MILNGINGTQLLLYEETSLKIVQKKYFQVKFHFYDFNKLHGWENDSKTLSAV